jgi:S1-C subfamily serine protease
MPVLLAAGLATSALAGCSSTVSGSDAVHARSSSPTQTSYERVISDVLPSVVEIEAGKSTGSGVVYNDRDDIVTNAHVVGDRKDVTVIASATAEPLPGRVIGVFAPDDLAVVRVLDQSDVLKPVSWADSSKAQPGQIVLAMGSPFGLIDSVTQGIISATGRTVTGPRTSGKPISVITDALQTSAAINPGNSGGALVELSGAVLGIPSLTARDPQLGGEADGIGFAIPSNTVREIASQLIAKGRVTRSNRASLQVIASTNTDKAGRETGVRVDGVQPGGVTAKAGVRPGDVILAIDGHSAANLTDLEDLLISYPPGRKVMVRVRRGNRVGTVPVTLGSLSSGPAV